MTSAEELQKLEQESFLEWRKQLSEVEAIEGIILTPFEKNLEFWRQLWRVIERSDVVVQIVDARDPMLFWCKDLENYVKEINPNKICLILINKADFLNTKQRKEWAEYFKAKGRKVVFFSALQELNFIEDGGQHKETEGELDEVGKIYTRLELIDYFKSIYNGEKYNSVYTTIGLVGYPNVGKSSTINTLLNAKKTSVSVTPGKTKHFQTLFVEPTLCLCDCPGLVMPMFLSTKADMIVSGILPIDQMRDYIPAPLEEENNPNRSPSAVEMLNAYAYSRGFMTARGLPDIARGARYVIKDYVSGKLLFCHAPPAVDQSEFQTFSSPTSTSPKVPTNAKELKVCQPSKGRSVDVDDKFFKKETPGVHFKNVNANHSTGSSTGDVEKPWKRHNNQNKREKLRRLYNDQSQVHLQ
ncbi:Viral Genome polyprotein [Chamberlinius hualienensis]